MALPEQITTREQQKFFEDEDGNVAVRTSAKGSFTVSGLKTGGKVTEVEITNTEWRPLPATALVGRNAMAIQNSSDQDIKLNYIDSVGYIGVLIIAGGERAYDIAPEIVIYGRSKTSTCTITIEELA